MTRLRALGYGALVAVVAFYYLAVPTLRELFGPVAVLPAYAAVAVLVGAATYHGVRFLSAREAGTADDREPPRPSFDDGGDGDGREVGDRDVEEMLGELEADREE